MDNIFLLSCIHIIAGVAALCVILLFIDIIRYIKFWYF